jgi:hypothetical protein
VLDKSWSCARGTFIIEATRSIALLSSGVKDRRVTGIWGCGRLNRAMLSLSSGKGHGLFRDCLGVFKIVSCREHSEKGKE